MQLSARLNPLRAWRGIIISLVYCLMLFLSLPVFAAEQQASTNSDVQVMGSFTRNEIIEGEAIRIADHEKRLILFIMGLSLLILVISTAVLGVAMAIYGKQVFVAHMIVAGFTVTLAVAHAVVAIVWFFPF